MHRPGKEVKACSTVSSAQFLLLMLSKTPKLWKPQVGTSHTMGCTRHDKMTWIDLMSPFMIFPDIFNKQSSDSRCLCRSDTDSLLHPEGASCKLNEFFGKSAQLYSWEGRISMSGSPLMKPLSFTKKGFFSARTVRTCQLLSPLLDVEYMEMSLPMTKISFHSLPHTIDFWCENARGNSGW